MPVAVYPDPETEIFEIVTFAFPLFVTVTFWTPVVFTTTLPKFTLAGLADN